jgi:hypothetical protein
VRTTSARKAIGTPTGNLVDESRRFLELGMDGGLFIDQPTSAYAIER